MTQAKAILQRLKSGKGITPLQALKYFGCFRLASRVFELRGMGWDIRSSLMTVGGGKRVSMYYLRRHER